MQSEQRLKNEVEISGFMAAYAEVTPNFLEMENPPETTADLSTPVRCGDLRSR
jgi:hypothetical protein